MNIDAASIPEAREAMATTARTMLTGHLSYIEGAHRICALFYTAAVDPLVEPFVTFLGVSSETETVPFGWLRDNWHSDTKAESEKKWQLAEEWAKRALEKSCQDLVTWVSD